MPNINGRKKDTFKSQKLMCASTGNDAGNALKHNPGESWLGSAALDSLPTQR